jgi:ornithine cyclodeaminase/alanine dehydrogenase-like protein (mu-crystallin family)
MGETVNDKIASQSARPTLLLTDEDVSAVAEWKPAIEALRRAYGAKVDPQSVPPRSMARAPGVWLRSLTAISPLDGYLGCKLIAASPRARLASYLITLFDQATMNLDALIDGNQITGIRTAATAVVAIDALAPRRALRVAMLGSGFEARAQLTALNAARAIKGVKVFSPTTENRERFAEHFRTTLNLSVQPTTTPEAAVSGADVVVCAARARNESPVLLGKWLEPGMTVVSIGSTLPEQREAAVDVIERARLIFADMPEEVAHGTGDMLEATRSGIEFMHKLVSLSELISKQRAAREGPEDIVLYKSVGSALQDVVIAEMLFARARARGIGTVLSASIAPVAK